MNKPKRKLKSYSDNQKAMALADLMTAGERGLSRVARKHNVARKTLSGWRDDLGPASSRARTMALKTAPELANEWQKLAEKSVAQSLAMIGEASARDSAVVGGIATDKMQLLRDLPTSIQSHILHPAVARYTPDQIREMLRLKEQFDAQLAAKNDVVVDALTPAPLCLAEVNRPADGGEEEALFDSAEKLEE